MNEKFYNNLDENFEQAYKMSEKLYTHDELLDLLRNGNIPQKQIAALKFDYVQKEDDANALLSNLTGCDGKIREAVALRINQILNTSESSRIIFSNLSAKIFADASIDINANICRLAVDSAAILKFDRKFAEEYVYYIMNYTKEALEELDKFIFRDKKYVINKQLFKLYWCLEGIKYFQEFIDKKELETVIQKASEQKEYTIREKTAQIVVLSNEFPNIENKLKNDENYYVRACFK